MSSAGSAGGYTVPAFGRTSRAFGHAFGRAFRAAVSVLLLLGAAACAPLTPPGALRSESIPLATDKTYSGRMAVKVEGPKAQSFTAAFELRGNPSAGMLLLSTPLGSALGSITWTPTEAVLNSNGEIRRFSSLDALIAEVMGTAVPVGAFFEWLDGKNVAVEGWQVDSSELSSTNRLSARRESPLPVTELKLVLDQQ